jgi:1-phosphofructokinase
VRRPLSSRRRVRDVRRLPEPTPPSDGTIVVFAPSPLLTVTIELGTDRPEVHLHPGGQGFWVAWLAATLGSEVTLCCALAGEPGNVLRGLIGSESLSLKAADARTPNGGYVHDRRSGDRVEIVSVDARTLTRHAVDELYGIALGAGLDADVTLLTGCQPPNVIDPEFYGRLARDLRTNGKVVIADLTGPPLRAGLDGGIDLLKLSEEELLAENFASSAALEDIVKAAWALHEAGARHVLVSRASAAAVFIDGASRTEIELAGPVFEPLDHHGTGDSMFAATGVGLARGLRMIDALRLGMAAGALNATRRGLGTGTRDEIERLAAHVAIRPWSSAESDELSVLSRRRSAHFS